MDSSLPKLHLFNAFHSPYGGSELEALDLYSNLSKVADANLWAASSRGSDELVKAYGMRRTRPLPGHMPDGGHYIFVGTHWRGKCWPRLAKRPDRLIYIYNTFHPKLLTLTSKVPPGWPEPEYVAISRFQCERLGMKAQVHPSPIDLDRFTPRPEKVGQTVRIGRMSRDTADKHDPADRRVYRAMADLGAECWIQGGTCLADELEGNNIRLGPAGEFEAADFLRQLDVFYYRTGEHVETFGRVVFEAMACGLPVVCHTRGGYAEWIEHDRNGLLFDSTDEAQQLLTELVNDGARRQRLGEAARQTVERMYSDEAIRERLRFYTKPRDCA